MEESVAEKGGQKIMTERLKMSFWMGITVVAMCASSRQEVDENRLSVHCVPFRSSAETVMLLHRPRQSSCRE